MKKWIQIRYGQQENLRCIQTYLYKYIHLLQEYDWDDNDDN